MTWLEGVVGRRGRKAWSQILLLVSSHFTCVLQSRDVLKPEADEDVVQECWFGDFSPWFPIVNGLKCSAGAAFVPVGFLPMCLPRSCGVVPEVSGASRFAQEVPFQ